MDRRPQVSDANCESHEKVRIGGGREGGGKVFEKGGRKKQGEREHGGSGPETLHLLRQNNPPPAHKSTVLESGEGVRRVWKSGAYEGDMQGSNGGGKNEGQGKGKWEGRQGNEGGERQLATATSSLCPGPSFRQIFGPTLVPGVFHRMPRSPQEEMYKMGMQHSPDPERKTTSPKCTPPLQKSALSKPTQKALKPDEPKPPAENGTTHLTPEKREEMITGMEVLLKRYEEMGWATLIEQQKTHIQELKDGAAEAQAPEAPASKETKKMQLLSSDQHRVQTHHESKMKEMEEEKEKAESEIERLKEMQKKKIEEQNEEQRKAREFLAAEFQRFHSHAAESLAKVEEKLKTQKEDHSKNMQEIQEQMGKHVQLASQNQEPYEDGEAAWPEKEGQFVMKHFTEDETLKDLTPAQAEAVLQSVAALMAKKVERKQQQQHLYQPVDVSDDEDDDELLLANVGDEEGFKLGKKERKKKRQEAKARAEKDGMMAVDLAANNVDRPLSTKRVADKIEVKEGEEETQTRKSQNTSYDVAPGASSEDK